MKAISRNIHLILGLLVVAGLAVYWQVNSIMGLSLVAVSGLWLLIQAIWLKRQAGNFSSAYFSERMSPGETLEKAKTLIDSRQMQLNHTVEAIRKIQEGSSEISLEGEAGQAVKSLSDSLKAMKEQENRQNWVVNGLAQLGEIRKSHSNLEDYTYQIINALVKYLGANQAAFYILSLDEANPELELKAAYAYGKRKYTDGKVTVAAGTGLVGQCVMERELILMTDVPKDYVKITSGLGEATPRCITITPLVFREKVYGVIEIASFEAFMKHHIEFINKISESIAAELADVITQSNTALLLKQSQEQAQELKSQEEELRQNMEEMQATQEEMKRKEVQLLQNMKELNTAQVRMKNQEGELKMQLKQVLAERRKNLAILEGCVDGVVSFNEVGQIQFFNAAAEEVFACERDEVIGEPIQNLLAITFSGSGTNPDDWRLLTDSGKEIVIRTEMEAKNKSGENISVLVTSTKVKLPDEMLFTVFIQKISIDLF